MPAKDKNCANLNQFKLPQKLVKYAKENLANPVVTFIDIHGHSRKKYFFFYGCNPKQSWNESDRNKIDDCDNSYSVRAFSLYTSC